MSCDYFINMDNENILTKFDPYHADIQSMIDSYVTSADNTPTSPQYQIHSIPHHVISNTFDRDPAISENLTDELRWLLIQHGPHQPRNGDEHLIPSTALKNPGKGIVRFRVKWFDDIRFSDWLEYSLTSCRAYCFYCRLFADSNRNRAFSRNGIKNWRKCMGSRGQKKKRSTESNENIIVCQRRGLLESHAMSESHKQAYQKYLTFIAQKHLEAAINAQNQQDSKNNNSFTESDIETSRKLKRKSTEFKSECVR